MAGTTTVVFTDIADSTGLVRRLGDQQAATLISDHFRVLRAETERCHGKTTKTLGDGIMAVFATAYDGVRAAVAMQQAVDVAARRRDTPPIGLRVGIHVGDVIEDGEDDVFGEAVVIARRLCDAASPGQILASELVRMLVGNRPDMRFVTHSPIVLKGGGEPVGTAQVEWASLPVEAPVRVIVADDASLIRSGIVRLLSDEGFEVVAEASNYDSLIEAIDRIPTDLVVTDIRMPPSNRDEGLRAAEYVKAFQPNVAVLILSQYVEGTAATSLLGGQTAGVGYLLKERVSEVDEFIRTARAVARGESVIDPLVTEQLMSRRRADSKIATLSDRERQVLELMAQGLSNQAICSRLYLSAKTVETHVRSIFIKLSLPDDTEGHRRVQAVIQWLGAEHR
jgi:DNA-binding NarL/FixJ family response regulator/class 3 adenylate cyclase